MICPHCGKPIPAKSKDFQPPTLEEVQAYCIERKNNVDAMRWLSYYESKGWLVGRSRMKDWRAAVRTWERSELTPAKEPERFPAPAQPVSPAKPKPCMRCGNRPRLFNEDHCEDCHYCMVCETPNANGLMVMEYVVRNQKQDLTVCLKCRLAVTTCPF